MPSTSEKQRRFFGAALGRARSGQKRAGDPKVPISKLRDFARKPISR